MDEILTIHNKIFDYLIELHNSDPNFLFMPRRINNRQRLEKGYWFIGDENYLQITFWDNDDPKRHIHNIAFTINLEKGCYLEFSSKYDEQKAKFLESLIKQIGDFEKIAQNRWRKYFGHNDYLELLSNFIQNEKKLIDNAIQENQPDGINFIPKAEFEKYIGKIYSYKEKVKSEDKLSNNLNIFYEGPNLDAYTLAHLNYTIHLIANKIAAIDLSRDYEFPFFYKTSGSFYWNSDPDIIRLEIKNINSKHSIEEDILILGMPLLSSQWRESILQNLAANMIWGIAKSGLTLIKSIRINKETNDEIITDPYEIGPNLADTIKKISNNSNGKPWKLTCRNKKPNGEVNEVVIETNRNS